MAIGLMAIDVVLAAFAYGVCVLIVLGITFGAVSLFGDQLVVKGHERWTWHVVNVLAWVVASMVAGAIVQMPMGLTPLFATCALAVILLGMQIRATFAMKRQQSAWVQLILCVLSPGAAFAVWGYLSA